MAATAAHLPSIRKTGKSVANLFCKKAWYVQYYFHDPKFREDPKLKYGKLVIIKGMNKSKPLQKAGQRVSGSKRNWPFFRNEGFHPITLKGYFGFHSLRYSRPDTALLHNKDIILTMLKARKQSCFCAVFRRKSGAISVHM